MPATSTRKQFVNLIPVGSDVPAVHTFIANAVNAIEERIVHRAVDEASASDAVTGFAPFTNGMLMVTTGGSAPEIRIRHGGAWKNPVPRITSGTAAPSGGADGDIYFQVI
jgi:hypothetical protein